MTTADVLGMLLFILVIILVMVGVVSFFDPSRGMVIKLSAERWECTDTTYPDKDKKEMFRPYCSQYTAKKDNP